MRNVFSVISSLLLASLLALPLASVTSCSGSGAQDGPKVLVIHSYEDEGLEGAYFRKQLDKEFRTLGVRPQTRHVYTDLLHTQTGMYTEKVWKAGLSDELKAWAPDFILVNDDPALNWMLEVGDPIFRTTPVIVAGINVVDSVAFKKFPRLTGFEDRIDFKENLRLIKELTGCNSVTIPLDFVPDDRMLRKQLSADLKGDTLYVDNLDFHLKQLGYSDAYNGQGDKLVVNAISMLRNPANAAPGSPASKGIEKSLLSAAYASNFRHLQVKYDLFSNFLIESSGEPQFTAIHEQFGDSDHLFLCGYFTGLDLQIRDQAKCTAKILSGFPVESMTIRLHKKKYYMDYGAMKRSSLPLSYRELSDRFEFVGVSLPIRHTVAFAALALVLLVFAVLGLVAAVRKSKSRKKTGRPVEEKIRKYNLNFQIKQLLMHTSDLYLWRFDNGTISFFSRFAMVSGLGRNFITLEELEKKCVDPAGVENLKTLVRNIQSPGKYRTTLKLTFDEGRTWHWWDVIYEGRASTSRRFFGLVQLVDKFVDMELKITHAVDVSSEALLKENFLANISHDIRTPLGAVTGFAQLLSEPDITKEDAELYSGIVKENSKILLELIEDVASRSEEDEGIMSINKERIRIADLVYNCYLSNEVLVPQKLTFRYIPCKGPPASSSMQTRCASLR